MAELFATGIAMGESPRWHDGQFWMCDWMAGEVLVFNAAGNREVAAPGVNVTARRSAWILRVDAGQR